MRIDRDQVHFQRTRQRSTTRAIAWGAMFFAFLAFVISLVTLFLCWRDGQLARNAVMVSRELSTHWRSSRGGPAAAGGEEAERAERLRGSLQRIDELLSAGDATAGYHIDALRQDMDAMRRYAGAESADWLGQASLKLQEARADIARNAPAAAAKVKALIDDVPRLMGDLRRLEEARERIRDFAAPGAPRATQGERSSDATRAAGRMEEATPTPNAAGDRSRELDAPADVPLDRPKYESSDGKRARDE